jgi:hypothetical protein
LSYPELELVQRPLLKPRFFMFNRVSKTAPPMFAINVPTFVVNIKEILRNPEKNVQDTRNKLIFSGSLKGLLYSKLLVLQHCSNTAIDKLIRLRGSEISSEKC